MLTPTIAVVTNIDREHMDYYHDMDDVRKCFADFVNKVPFYGAAILCIDDPNVQAVIPHVQRRRITYGMTAQADVSAHDINFDTGYGSRFNVMQGAEMLGEVNLPVPGKHNIYNALAAVAVGLEFGMEFAKIAEALNSFTNADRRFQVKGQVNDVLVVDDYGHHPTEIKATLSAAKNSAAGRRIVVLFQPHRYTRTQDLLEEFARSFNNADALYLLDIYAASEDPIEGVTAEALAEEIKKYGHKNVHYVGTIENAVATLAAQTQSGDLVITLGAGTVYRAGEQLLETLKQ